MKKLLIGLILLSGSLASAKENFLRSTENDMMCTNFSGAYRTRNGSLLKVAQEKCDKLTIVEMRAGKPDAIWTLDLTGNSTTETPKAHKDGFGPNNAKIKSHIFSYASVSDNTSTAISAQFRGRASIYVPGSDSEIEVEYEFTVHIYPEFQERAGLVKLISGDAEYLSHLDVKVVDAKILDIKADHLGLTSEITKSAVLLGANTVLDIVKSSFVSNVKPL